MKKHNVLGSLRRTTEKFSLIKEGDRVAVGLSGGKDSMALLHVLSKYQRFSPMKFDLFAITVNPGFEGFATQPLKEFCDSIEVPFIVENTDIAEIVFDIRKEQNPCSLCANIRRGTLATAMNREGINKLALGHHADDRLATFLMSFLYTGKMKTLEYSSYLDRTGITVIRPLIETSEESIVLHIKENGIPVLKSPCPVDKKTKREDMSNLIKEFEKQIPNSRKAMLNAITNSDGFNLYKHIDLGN